LALALFGCSFFSGDKSDDQKAASDAAPLGELRPAGEEEYYKGDFKGARPLLTQAGRSGNLRAAFFLRIITEYGLDGLLPNPDEADTLLNLLAAHKDTLTLWAKDGPRPERPIYQASLAILYLRGYISELPDSNQALPLARLSASSGFYPAMNILAAALLGSSSEATKATSNAQIEAYQAVYRAAFAGDVLAMGNISYLTRLGIGTTAAPFMAATWSHRAANLPQTTARSLNDLGFFYEEGRAVSPDLAEATKWYTLADQRGYPLAAANLKRLKSQAKTPPEVYDFIEY
jgi:TPR repeat protein